MIAFLKEISRACRSFPERTAVVDHDEVRSTDYRSLNTEILLKYGINKIE